MDKMRKTEIDTSKKFRNYQISFLLLTGNKIAWYLFDSI